MVSCLGDRKGLNGHKPKKQVNSKKKKKQKQRNTNPNDCLSLRLANLNNYWKRILYRIRWQCFCGVAVDYVTNIETYPTLCLFFSLGGIGQGGLRAARICDIGLRFLYQNLLSPLSVFSKYIINVCT